jgi:putative transposase
VHGDSSEAPGGVGDWVLEGKEAIAIARLSGKERNFSGEHFWARGYAVSTMGFELEQVRPYIPEQEAADANGQF